MGTGYRYTIKTLWGLAKSKELGLTEEELHLLPERRGNPQTGRQRRKIGQLKEKLGWEERQVRALCHRMYRVDAVEWLTYYQCQGLIEAMKAILERKPEKEDGRG